MVKKLDKTFYYVVDEDEVLHISRENGYTVCGLDVVNTPTLHAIEFADASMYDLCGVCKETKIKTATFETKAEFVDEPAKGELV